MASAFPPKYMAAVMLGNGIAGLGTNLLRVATLFIWPADEGEKNAFRALLSLYIFTFAVLCLDIICQLFFQHNEFANYYLQCKENSKEKKSITLAEFYS